ncbi:aspartate kinase [Saccharothrix sp. NPDC042600]|uniref:aspartate kinase n=1 Tax=Saccharothrix TaxID=2071 RepID=UPI003409A86E|nr:aspartate kinase [Saccharothrix mutabilis subsp. capreolus]
MEGVRDPHAAQPAGGRGAPPPGAVLVRKYGGSSLATPARVRAVARALADVVGAGHRVVVVVSAMGRTTDDLVALARLVGDRPDPRELDQLLATGEQASAALVALALRGLGVRAGSLCGDQAGIVVGGRPGAGVVQHVERGRLLARLRQWDVAVVAGFQGRTEDDDVRTLGRGGSDTTAVALAAALGGDDCEIFTDVPGVLTADPSVVPGARRLPTVPYDVMLELAGRGAKVLHPRSVAVAARHGVRLRVAHTERPEVGTTVAAAPLEGGHRVVGVAHERDVRLVTVSGVPWPFALAHLAHHGLAPDVVVRWDADEVRFTVRGAAAADVLPGVVGALGAQWSVEDGLGSVSVVGTGLLDHPRYLAGTLDVLQDAVVTMTTSPSRFTAVVAADRVAPLARALHAEFGLAEAAR